jgi:Cu+-exporting ATPase
MTLLNKTPADGGLKKTVVAVGGMTCAACVRRVENAIKEVIGVQDAVVNLANGHATVMHSTQWEGPAALARVVAEQGYEYLGEIKIILPIPSKRRVLKNSGN